MSTIQLTNVGPITSFELSVPAGGGLIEFLGPHGAGKSHALAAIQAAAEGGSKYRPPVSDGKAGAIVNAFGGVMTIGRKTHHDTAALSVAPLEGRFSIGDLIDPALKNPAAADAARIKAILQITGQKPDLAPFYDLLGGREEFERAVKSTTLALTEDVVQFAEAAKRDLEAKAREAADEALKAEERARIANAAAEGVDTAAESDPAKLNAEVEAAIRAEQAIATRLSQARRAQAQIDLAADALEEASKGYQGPTVAEAVDAERRAEEASAAQLDVVKAAEEALRAAEKVLSEAKAKSQSCGVALATAIRERKAAEAHEATLASYRKTLEEIAPKAPSIDEQEAATRRVVEARQAAERGVLVRKALADRQAAKAAIEAASRARVLEQRLRNAAGGVEKVLSEAVAKVGGPLFVEGGRLKLQTDRGSECYAELSDGERCLEAVRIAVRAVGPNGLVVLPQRFNQELNDHDRGLIHADAREVGAYVITARITEDTEGGLRAQSYGGNGHGV